MGGKKQSMATTILQIEDDLSIKKRIYYISLAMCFFFYNSINQSFFL